MENLSIIILFLFVLFTLLGTGVWVGLALMGVAWVGMELVTTRPVGDVYADDDLGGVSSWTLTALPLFIWMGEILYRTRLSEDMFQGSAPWMARLPGGLVHTNIVGCTVFAAVSGSIRGDADHSRQDVDPGTPPPQISRTMIIGTLAGAATLGSDDPALADADRLWRHDQRKHHQTVLCGHLAGHRAGGDVYGLCAI